MKVIMDSINTGSYGQMLQREYQVCKKYTGFWDQEFLFRVQGSGLTALAKAKVLP